MNLYAYLLNNPFKYVDPDGQFIQFAVPLFAITWGAIETAIAWITAEQIATAAIIAAAGYAEYNQIQKERAREQRLLNEMAEEQENERKKNTDHSKRHSPDQRSLNELAQASKPIGLTNSDADTIA